MIIQIFLFCAHRWEKHISLKLFSLSSGNYVVVTNLQIYHPTFYLLCDAGTGTLQTVFLFFQLPYCWVHQFWGLMEPKGWKNEKGIDSLNRSFYWPTVLNCSMHNWFLSSAYFWQSQNQSLYSCSAIPPLATSCSFPRGSSPSTGRPVLPTCSFSNNSSLFHLLSPPQGSSAFWSHYVYIISVPLCFLNSPIPT